MLNSYAIPLPQTWVKNVYSLCVEGVVKGVQLYTGGHTSTLVATEQRAQPTTFTHILDSFTPALYTVNFRNFNQLITHLYTLSTGPTIKKKKENKKGN